MEPFKTKWAIMNGIAKPATEKTNKKFVFAYIPTLNNFHLHLSHVKQSKEHFINKEKNCIKCKKHFNECEFYNKIN